MSYNSSGELRISHHEVIGRVNGEIGLEFGVLDQRTLNPGESGTFSWLSGMAQHYERYRVERLCFRYTTVRPTTQQGMIVLACDYDPDDDHGNETSDEVRIALMGLPDSVCGPLWENTTLTSSPKFLNQGWKYVRTPIDFTIEARTADFGRLYYGVFGTREYTPEVSQTRWMGDLSVEYTFVLSNPQVPSSINTQVSSSTVRTVGPTNDLTVWDPLRLPNLMPNSGAWEIDTFDSPNPYVSWFTGPNPATDAYARVLKGFKGTITMLGDLVDNVSVSDVMKTVKFIYEKVKIAPTGEPIHDSDWLYRSPPKVENFVVDTVADDPGSWFTGQQEVRVVGEFPEGETFRILGSQSGGKPIIGWASLLMTAVAGFVGARPQVELRMRYRSPLALERRSARMGAPNWLTK